jgi:riboflavin kinase/FMN adenylyltransferase
LLAEACARAARRGGKSAVLTFTPHPARLFAPDRAPPLIMPLERRLELVAAAGIDIAIVEPFTREFAAIDAPAFVRDVLARDLGARDAVVGYDFSFGRGRAGNAQALAELGAPVGLEVAVIPPVAIDGVPCSSTRIRALVAEGETVAAGRLLGRPFELEGVVKRAGSASRPRTSRPRRSCGRSSASTRRARWSSMGRWPAPRAPRRSAWARIHISRATRSRSRPTCSTSTTISTISGCGSRSARGCGTNGNSNRSTR